jgi:hypothetical protein
LFLEYQMMEKVQKPNNSESSVVLFIALLHSNRSYLIFAYIFVAAGMCSPCHCLAMGLHVTISCKHKQYYISASCCIDVSLIHTRDTRPTNENYTQRAHNLDATK